MSAFDDALAFTLRWEGGYANDPNDPGGETYRGISRRAHSDWRGWRIIDRLANKDTYSSELDALVAEFYQEHCWKPIGGDLLPYPIALTLFDWAVHSGTARAVKSLQTLVGASPDGVFGPKTLESVWKSMGQKVAFDLLREREQFVARLLNDSPGLARYRRGWENRLQNLSDTIA